jgi:hypothetical protein
MLNQAEVLKACGLTPSRALLNLKLSDLFHVAAKFAVANFRFPEYPTVEVDSFWRIYDYEAKAFALRRQRQRIKVTVGDPEFAGPVGLRSLHVEVISPEGDHYVINGQGETHDSLVFTGYGANWQKEQEFGLLVIRDVNLVPCLKVMSPQNSQPNSVRTHQTRICLDVMCDKAGYFHLYLPNNDWKVSISEPISQPL